MKPILLLIVALPTGAGADIVLSVDKLDASDGLPLPSTHIVVIDLSIATSSDETWESAGIVAHTSNGAALHYEYDPNGDPLVTAPGIANRFTTFLSTPRGRNDDARFLPDASVLISGPVFGGTSPVFHPDFINVAYGEPAPPPPAVEEGYIARLALDLSQVQDPAFQVDSPNIVVAQSRPPGSVILLESIRGQNEITFVFTRAQLSSDYLDWGVYGIPEPASVFLVFAAFAMFRWVAR